MRSTVTPELRLILPKLKDSLLPAAFGPGFFLIALTRSSVLQSVSVFIWASFTRHIDIVLVQSPGKFPTLSLFFYLTPKDT